MSHHSGLSLVALHKEDISAYFGKALATRLIGDEAQSLPEGKPQYPVYMMHGHTRSDWFKWNMGALLERAHLPSLKFVSETACTDVVLRDIDTILDESYLDGLDEGNEARNAFMTHYYTVIPPLRGAALRRDIEELIAWTGKNVAEVSDVVEWGEEEVINARASAVSCVGQYPDVLRSINHYGCHGEEGDDPLFLFCALKSIQELFSIAGSDGLYLIYENENYTGLDWLKNNRPDIIRY